ncbi:MAG: hypothetical protein IKD73_07470 [Selenomonadaceae bacterium]|nr:hypothetical protein [Selenomonadaceae bacterium]
MGDILIGGYAKVTATTSTVSAAIGSGRMRNISIGDNATVTATSGSAAAIGAGQQSSVGDISIGNNATVIAKSQNAGAGIGTAPNLSRAGNILIGGNASVTATSFYGAGIGCGSFNNYYYGENPSVGDITISSSATVNAQSRVGDDIGGANHYPGSIVGTISNGLTTFDITLDLGIIAQVEPTTNSSTGTTSTDKTRTKEIAGNPLRIQSGTTADDFINVFIEDMRTKALGVGKLFDAGGNLINASDIAQYNALSSDTTKQAEWLATLKAADGKTLDDVSSTTRDNAIVAIRIIDGAIDYALNQATSLGAMDNRLGYTADNIVNGK